MSTTAINTQEFLPVSEDKSGCELVTDPVRISRLLRVAFENHSRLDIRIAKTPVIYQSIILGVRNEKSLLTIDEIIPRDQFSNILPGAKISISSISDGIRIGFDSSIFNAFSMERISAYEIKMPPSIQFHQRRNYFRANVGLYKKIPANLTFNKNVELMCSLRNISSGGIMVECDTSLTDFDMTRINLNEGVIVLEKDLIQLPSMKVCFVRTNRQNTRTTIGAEFHKMTRTTQFKIDRLVAEISRESLSNTVRMIRA
jgi:c-di-GMP-binding flagellar brake protein YcgR